MDIAGAGNGKSEKAPLMINVKITVNIMADAGKSSKMRENNRDLSDTMTKLIAPLYFRKNEEILFGKNTRFLRSRSAFDDNARVYFNFWDSIETNMHLASPSLFSALEEYRNAKDLYWDGLEENAEMFNAFEASPEGQVITRRFEDDRSELSLLIGHDYRELMKKLRPPIESVHVD